MLIRRRVQKPAEEPSIDLLSDLLDAKPQDTRLRPVVLRSLKAQRQEVLAPYPMRTWLDRALTVGERLLGAVVVVFFCWWLIDGYGRDWWHARNAAPTPVPAIHRRIVEAPVVTTTVASAKAELGVSLPVVDERWNRPQVTFDYLTPARMYVKPMQPTAAPVPSAAPAPRDLRPTHLTAPSAGIDSHVVEVFVQDGAWQVADYAVGYHHGTGTAGTSNMVLAGHAGLRGGVFRQLNRLKPGDAIFVDADGERFEYRVRGLGNVWPNQVDVMFPTEQAQLTLLTCTNWDTQRLVVVADFVGVVSAPAPAGGN
jgi:sortase A